jgi:hypothetical protein
MILAMPAKLTLGPDGGNGIWQASCMLAKSAEKAVVRISAT